MREAVFQVMDSWGSIGIFLLIPKERPYLLPLLSANDKFSNIVMLGDTPNDGF